MRPAGALDAPPFRKAAAEDVVLPWEDMFELRTVGGRVDRASLRSEGSQRKGMVSVCIDGDAVWPANAESGSEGGGEGRAVSQSRPTLTLTLAGIAVPKTLAKRFELHDELAAAFGAYSSSVGLRSILDFSSGAVLS